MNIDQWIKGRASSGTIAHLAVRVVGKGTYKQSEARLRQYCVLEALLVSDGNQEAAAALLGVHRHTVMRTLRALGLRTNQIREIARKVKGVTA